MPETSGTRKKNFRTSSGIEIRSHYTPHDVSFLNDQTHLGDPGEFPFTRGIHSQMYRSRLWTMRQYAGYASAEESNRRFRYLLSQGQMGLSIAFDLPTQLGMDSDDERCQGEVGKVGVAIDTLEDMEELFQGIPLDQVSTSMTINAPAAILLCMYVAVGEKQGVQPDRLSGTIQNDILKEYLARGTYIFPPKPSMRLITDTFAFCNERMPQWNTISISGYHIREAGSTAVQEVAFTLANAICYVEAALAAGLRLETFAPRLSFFFNAHNNLLEEVAKFRAARRLWATIMRDRFRTDDPRCQRLRFHAQTGGSTLTAQQPNNNLVRVTLQALAAVLGGAQSLHTNSRDEALALPSEEAALLALRTQQVIAYESGVADTVDPLGGSYFVERLTEDIARAAMQYLERIEKMGGTLEAIEAGYVQREIQQAAFEFQKRLENGEEVVVGLNRFVMDETVKPELLRIDADAEKKQIERLRRRRQVRDRQRVAEALRRVETSISDGTNLLPALLEAVRVYASVGEIVATMKRHFGEYRESVVL